MSLLDLIKGFTFEKSQLVYTAGESIKGTLILCAGDTREEYLLRNLRIELTCEIREPMLDPTEDQRPKKRKRPNSSIQPPCAFKFKSLITLRRNEILELPFNLKLRTTFLSTFISKRAYIWYGIKLQCTLDYRKLNDDGSISSSNSEQRLIGDYDIVIIGYVEAHPIPMICKIPLRQTVVHRSSKGEEVQMTVTIGKAWSLPGEMLNFEVEILSGINLPLNTVKAVLQQNMKYGFPKMFGYKRVPREARIVIWRESPVIAPGQGGKKTMWNGQLPIPYVVPTGLGLVKCPFIDVDYVLVFSLLKFVNLRISFPFHIGTRIPKDEDDSISVAYGSEMTKTFSESSYTLNMDCLSLMNDISVSGGSSSSWVPESEQEESSATTSSSSRHLSNPNARCHTRSRSLSLPPPYQSGSGGSNSSAETLPPRYEDAFTEVKEL